MVQKEARFASELAAREAIRDCLCVYARGIDRADAGVLRSAFWPDASIDPGGQPRSVDEFVTGSIRALQTHWDRVLHQIGNVLIRIEGDSAAVESCVHGYHCAAAARRDLVISGRYLDRFERRDGEWRIAARIVTVDWFRQYSDSGDLATGPMGVPGIRGGYGEADPSHQLFNGD